LAYLKDEIKAGVIIFTAVILMSAFTILIGGTSLFEDHDTYYVKVTNAAGLETGAQVKLGGVRVGSILDIKTPQGPGEKVAITIGLKKGTLVYQGTEAIITQVGFVGDIYLLLTVEKTGAELIGVGETIPSVEGVDFAVLMAKINVISESVDKLIHDVNKLFSDSTIDDIEKAVKNVSVVLNEINGLVRDTKGELSSMIKVATEDFKRAGEMIDSIRESAGAIESTARSVGNTSETVNGAVNLQSQNITDLLTSMTAATEALQEVLQEIKNKPWSIIYKERNAE
jgi:ABC-type transporter Mla subunit MlaD